jgi:hypothetical protein
MDLPPYPRSDDDDAADLPAPAPRWGPRIAAGALVILVVVIVIVHLSGVVGPAAH